MRNYKKIQTEKNTVTKIVCNKCKKEITIKKWNTGGRDAYS